MPRQLSTPAVRMTQQSTSPSSSSSEKVLSGPYAGKYGDWYLTKGDATGVQTYRAALAGMSMSAALSILLALSLGRSVSPLVYDALFGVCTISFGIALQTIHIYLRPLHNALKVCWGLGALGSIVLLASPLTDHSIVMSVQDHPVLLLAVGWQMIALTGLFIKEAACFGRREAAGLIALTPLLSAGKFLNVLPETVEQGGAAVFAVLFLVFAARKFTQPTTDDLGDKSVFDHLEKGGEL